jgi:hypothetical protein
VQLPAPVEQVLINKLTTTPAVSNLITPAGGGQPGIWPQVAPEDSPFPHVTYYRVSTQRTRHLLGTAMANPRIQFDCWGLDYPSAKNLALAIANCLNDFQGNLVGGTVKVLGIFLDDEGDDYIAPEHAEEAGVHKVGLSILVFYAGS